MRQRGSLTVWVTEEAVAAWAAAPRTTRGGQPWDSPLAILTALTLRAAFRLAYRQAEGLIASIIDLLGLTLRMPDHPTLSRRSAMLAVPRPQSNRGATARTDRVIFPKLLYKTRARIKQATGKLQRFKRIAMRGEKTVDSYDAFVGFALGPILIKFVDRPRQHQPTIGGVLPPRLTVSCYSVAICMTDASRTFFGAVAFGASFFTTFEAAFFAVTGVFIGLLFEPCGRPIFFGAAATTFAGLDFALSEAAFSRATFSSSRMATSAALITSSRRASGNSSAAAKNAFARTLVPRGARVVADCAIGSSFLNLNRVHIGVHSLRYKSRLRTDSCVM